MQTTVHVRFLGGKHCKVDLLSIASGEFDHARIKIEGDDPIWIVTKGVEKKAKVDSFQTSKMTANSIKATEKYSSMGNNIYKNTYSMVSNINETMVITMIEDWYDNMVYVDFICENDTVTGVSLIITSV